MDKQEVKKFTTAEINAFDGRSPIYSDWSTEKAIREGYKSSVWLYACVSKRADSVASVPLVVGRMLDGEFRVEPSHPLQALLDMPNPSMDQSEFLRNTVTSLDLGGNSYYGKIRGGKDSRPLELHAYQQDFIEVHPGARQLISHYVHSRVRRFTIPFEDMLAFKYLDPANPYVGMSPLMAAGKAVDIDNAANDFQKVSMQNRGTPDGVFSLEGENVTTEHYEQALKEIKRNKSGPSNARAMWVLAHAKFTQMAMSPVEMDFMATRKFTREEI